MVTIDSEFNIERCVCVECKHNFSFARLTCKAFPKEIPVEILNNNKFHDKIITGQVGKYVFEKK